MFGLSSNDLTLCIIILLLFGTIFYIYSLSIDLKLLEKDIDELKYPTLDSNK